MFRVIMLGLSSAERCLLTIPRKITIVNQSRGLVLASSPPSPAALAFPGHSSAEHSKEHKELFNHQKPVPAKHGTEFQLLNMPIMKFLKGETCTKARVEAILCGPMTGTCSPSEASQ